MWLQNCCHILTVYLCYSLAGPTDKRAFLSVYGLGRLLITTIVYFRSGLRDPLRSCFKLPDHSRIENPLLFIRLLLKDSQIRELWLFTPSSSVASAVSASEYLSRHIAVYRQPRPSKCYDTKLDSSSPLAPSGYHI